MSYKKYIPKALRKKYKRRIRSAFWVVLRSRLKFSKMYKKRHELYAMGAVKDNLHLPDDHLYWLFNCSERNFEECVYGDKGFQKRHKFDPKTASKRQKKRQSRRWFRRNPIYNRNHKIGMELGGGMTITKVIINEPPGENPARFRNKTVHGEQAVIMRSFSGMEVFRYSRTKKLSKLNPLRLLGYKYKNVMRGADVDEWTYKNRVFR